MTQLSKEHLQTLIEKAVQKEMRQLLPGLVASAVKQVMTEMIQKSSPSTEMMMEEATGYNNGGKRKNLMEVSYNSPEEMRAYPDMDARRELRKTIAARLNAEAGYAPTEITVDMMPSDPFGMNAGGQMIPIHPSQIPADVRKVLNKDYSDIMNTVILKK